MSFRSALMAAVTSSKPYKRQLSYLRATGTQYINTGVNLASDYTVEIKWRCTAPFASTTASQMIFGCSQSPNHFSLMETFANIASASGMAKCCFLCGQSSWATYKAYLQPQMAQPHVYRCVGKSFYVDGVYIKDEPGGEFSFTIPMFLFAYNASNTAWYKALGEMYYAKVWDGNGNLVQDLIPVLDDNDAAKMYDKVSGTYPTHVGTFEYE